MDPQQPVFDNVKFEKAKAMARYNRFRKIMKLLQLLEVSVALMLISWSSTRLPGALKISGRFLSDVADYLFNPHVVFVIGNIIIVAVFVLGRKSSAGGENENSGDGDVYDDYVRYSDAHAQRQKLLVEKNPAPEPPATPEIKDVIAGSGGEGEEESEEKRIVACSETDEKRIVACSVTEEKAEQCEAEMTAIETAKQIEKFQRTQSEKLKTKITVKPRGELRRSETVKVGRGRTEMLKMTSLDTVDKLSDEEFNMTIEAFIKRHQKSFREQKLTENEEFKKMDVTKSYRCASTRY